MASFNISKRTFLGLIIILIGVTFFLGTIGIIDSDYIFSTYWPILLIAFGLISLIDRSTRNIFGFTLVIVGVFYQVKLLNWFFEGIDIWNIIWPLFIIIVGFWFLFPKRNKTLSIDTLNQTAIFSGANVINTSSDFRGGELTAVFGGLEVDLRQTIIKTDESVIIDTFTAFGGISLKVPDNWRVEMRGLPIFGGWDNKKKDSKVGPEANHVVIVKCLILFGGIDIK